MSEQPTGQEKTHEASAQKLERARKKGDLVRSQDAQTAAAYLGLSLAMLALGGWSALYLGETLAAFLAQPDELVELFRGPAGQAMSLEIFGRIGAAIIPVILVPATLIILLLISQRAIVAAPEKLLPKWSRLSPVQNAKQKYGPTGLVEFLKSAVKLSAVGLVLAIAVLAEFDHLPSYVHLEPRFLPELLSRQFWNIISGVLVLAFVLAVADFLWQRHSHRKKMRMTHQELKDESKQSEGDPQVRASRRERARAIANNRMLNDVPTADVVITNPTHYAVALRWTRKEHHVPVCVAKGADEMAKRIRMRAEQAGVPIHEDAPTARSIHALVEVGQPIEQVHYKAVAAPIVFADKLRAQKRERLGARV